MNININADEDAQWQQQEEQQEPEPPEMDDNIGNIHVLTMHQALIRLAYHPSRHKNLSIMVLLPRMNYEL